MSDKRKMAFYEIDRGKLGLDVQRDFERAQRIAMARGVSVSVKVEILIAPPSDDAMFGNVSYKHSIKEPPIASKQCTICLEDGIMARDAEQPLEQLDLLNDDDNLINFQKGVSNE